MATALALANNYGGWERVTALNQAIKRVADKHGVRMQTVALRWQIDQVRFLLSFLKGWAMGVHRCAGKLHQLQGCDRARCHAPHGLSPLTTPFLSATLRLQGTFPVASIRWGERAWSQFGYYYHTGPHPGVDWQLFQVRPS